MLLDKTEQLKKQSRALLDQFYKEGKQKEVIIEDEFWHKANEVSLKARKAYQAQTEVIVFLEEMRTYAERQFKQELLAAKLTKNTSALKALPRVEKRWKALSNGARVKYGQQREIGILQLLQDKKIKAEWAKGGAVAGYTEAMDGGNRSLTDDEWQGRVTAREIHSNLEATSGSHVAGDKYAKEIRRDAKGLGIRLAEDDKRGRKWKPPVPVKQKPKKPPGRPRIRPEIIPAGDTEGAEGIQRAISGARVNTTGHVLPEYCHRGKFGYGNTSYSSEIATWPKVRAEIERDIRRLTLRRGGRKGEFEY